MAAYRTQLRVRVHDVNYGGHLGHDALISLVHDARCQLLAEHHLSELDCAGCALFMRSIRVDYLAEAVLHDVLDIDIACGEQRGAQFTLMYRIWRGDVLIARASGQMVSVNPQTRKPCRLPQALSNLLNNLKEDESWIV